MAYHTAAYLFFFLPFILLLYQLMPREKRWVGLLLAGYAFFWMVSGKLVVFLIMTTLFTHYIGVWIQLKKLQCREEIKNSPETESRDIKKRYKKKEKHILIFGVGVLLAVLVELKYCNFFLENVNRALQMAGSARQFEPQIILLPIGISFYTLQAIGYLADVYWDKIKEEQPLGKVALFLGFFPQIMEGPISMYAQTADALWSGEPLHIENLSRGFLRIFWGLFKKIIIADRLYVLVQAVFDHYFQYTGGTIAIAAVAYTVQLYMEFSGCMDIVIGSGRLFNVILPENFCQPFASVNASEFWKRWHITLGVWFKTYIFYPVSVSPIIKKWNQFGKKHLSKYGTRLGVSAICLFPVWLCNGLWHGPRWSYLFYGMYYFTILMLEQVLEPAKKKLIKNFDIHEAGLLWKAPQIAKTWLIIVTGELFFRANGLHAGIQMFCRIFQEFTLGELWNGTFMNFGLDLADYAAIAVGCVVVGFVGFLKERNLLVHEKLMKVWLPVRWAVYYALILSVIIFGAYGIGYQQVDLIYAGF